MKYENFVESLRDTKVSSAEQKRHWPKYKPNEVEAYISKLEKQMRNTEKVFQESHDDLRNSLLAMTRERDELLAEDSKQKIELSLKNQELALKNKELIAICETPKDEVLKSILKSKSMIAMPKDLYSRMRHGVSDYKERVLYLEVQYQELDSKYRRVLNDFGDAKTENQNLIEEKDSLKQESIKFQHLAKEKSQEIFNIVSQCIVDFEKIED